jgi:hypothetical protein
MRWNPTNAIAQYFHTGEEKDLFDSDQRIKFLVWLIKWQAYEFWIVHGGKWSL